MSSKVISGTGAGSVERMHWLSAPGQPVNAAPPNERGKDTLRQPPLGGNAELDAALQRVDSLERRVQELEAELPRRFEAGRMEGRAEGERSAAEGAHAALRPLKERLTATLAELAGYRARFRREAEPELLRLTLAVARKILRRELTVDPSALQGILKAAVETINKAEILSIHAAPEDAPQLAGQLQSMGLPAGVEVLPDRTLEPGSIRIHTRRGQIDAGVQTQLAEIESGFADRIGVPIPQ